MTDKYDDGVFTSFPYSENYGIFLSDEQSKQLLSSLIEKQSEEDGKELLGVLIEKFDYDSESLKKKILSCPVCGSDNVHISDSVHIDDDRYFHVYCEYCGVRGEESFIKEEAVDNWNSLHDIEDFVLE